MSASAVHSLASTQDDVASIELDVTTAASYNIDDEGALLNLAAISPPVAYEDDASEKAAALTHSPHTLATPPSPYDDDVEVTRREDTQLSIGEEFTARVQELLAESKTSLKVENALVSDDEEEKSDRLDSEEEGVETALEIGVPNASASGASCAIPATPPCCPQEARATPSIALAATRARLLAADPRPFPRTPTPRPFGVRDSMRLPGLSGLVPPPPPPFFAAGTQGSMYSGFNPGGRFGLPGFCGPSMRPFNSLLPPGGPLPPHLFAEERYGGLGRPLHLGGGPLLPPRAYMGGGPPASLTQGGSRRAPFHHIAMPHHPHPPPPPHLARPPPPPLHHHHPYHNHANQPPPSSVAPAERRTVDTPRRGSDSLPRRGDAFSTMSVASMLSSPSTNSRQPFGRIGQSPGGRDHLAPSMASLGIGHAAAMLQAAAAAQLAGAVAALPTPELTPYPLVYVSPAGSISCVLNHDVFVEMAVDRSLRIVLHDDFAAFCNARGTASAILHPSARIVHTEDYVHTKFIANNEKMAVFGEQGVLFTMSHLSEAYLVNSAVFPGVSAVALDQLEFPTMDEDYTIKMFYTEAQTGPQFIALCKDIVSEATYDRRPDGSLYLHINGMLIRQSTEGDVIIDARPRQISCSPSKKSVHVRSGCIDMAVEEDDRGYVKREHKRVHVSRSGMVVSDGNCVTSMDHFGRIICSN